MTRKRRLFIVIGAPLLCAAAFLFREPILNNVQLPPCQIHARSGIYCPGCGNTRSVEAMLHGNIFLALRNNITIPFLSVVLLLLYLETAIGLSGREVHLLPRKEAFWYVVLGLFVAYFVARNFLPAIAPV